MPSGSASSLLPARVGEQFSATDERRRRPRLRLQLPVTLHSGSAEALNTVTRDISSEGFLCITARAFHPGEGAVCVIDCPSNAPDERPIQIQCCVRILRCELESDTGLYRTACYIKSYRCTPVYEPNAT
jgi:hypothetical protein